LVNNGRGQLEELDVDREIILKKLLKKDYAPRNYSGLYLALN
jgi:hypothetical protein